MYEYSSIKGGNLKRYLHYVNNIKIYELKVSTHVGFGTNIYFSMILFYINIWQDGKKCLLYSNILLSFYYLARILSSSHYGSVNVNIGENTEAPCRVSISDISLYYRLILVDVM